MLTELYQYALDHTLTARPGFKPKTVKCYVRLTSDGRFVDIVPSEKGQTMAPDIGGLANGTSCCNILIEKAQYPLCILTGDVKKDKNTPTKHAFYLNALRQGADFDPAFAAVLAALEDKVVRDTIAGRLCEKYKPWDPIGFEVSGIPVEAGTSWLDWWDGFRRSLGGGQRHGDEPVCLITGQNAPALETVAKVNGLLSVGGHTAGDAFLCFDKDAFTSYGLKKSANASVSEMAMTGVNAALLTLIGRAPVFGGAKMVYWYSSDIPKAQDPLTLLLDFDPFGGVELQTESDDQQKDEESGKKRDRAQREAEAEAAIKRLIDSVKNGKKEIDQPDARYYIMPVSGMSGRMMVRGWYEGSFAELYRNVGQWYADLELMLPGREGRTRPPKLKRLCIVLLKPGGDTKVFDRMDKELSGLLGRLFNAVISGAPLPDMAASKALYTLRSSLMGAGQSDDGARRSGQPPLAVYQLLKCWLVRRQRERGEVIMQEQLNPDYPAAAYHCGRMMAVYSAIQQEALGRDIGAGVVERYYGAAIVSPNFVLGSLSRLSNYHLAKIENQNHALRLRRMLNEISSRIAPGSIPRIMSMEQQTEFALGYYQQNAAIYTKNVASEEDDGKNEQIKN